MHPKISRLIKPHHTQRHCRHPLIEEPNSKEVRGWLHHSRLVRPIPTPTKRVLVLECFKWDSLHCIICIQSEKVTNCIKMRQASKNFGHTGIHFFISIPRDIRNIQCSSLAFAFATGVWQAIDQTASSNMYFVSSCDCLCMIFYEFVWCMFILIHAFLDDIEGFCLFLSSCS